MTNKNEIPEVKSEWYDKLNDVWTVTDVANSHVGATLPVTVVARSTTGAVAAMSLTQWHVEMSVCCIAPVDGITIEANYYRFIHVPNPENRDLGKEAASIIRHLTSELWKLGVPITKTDWASGFLLSTSSSLTAMVSTTINFRRNFGYISGDEAKKVHAALSKWIGLPVDKEKFKDFVDFDKLEITAYSSPKTLFTGYREGKEIFQIKH